MLTTSNLRVARTFLQVVLWLTIATPCLGQELIPAKDFYVTDDVVETIEVVGDSVYVGGRFTHVGPYTGPLAPVSIATGATIPGFPEANDVIFALESDGAGGWYVGGDFTEIGGVARNRAAHILPDLSVDPAWDPNAGHRVNGFAVHDTAVYLYGFFTDIGGQPRFRIASVAPSTGAVTAWDPNPTSGGVEDICLDGNTLYVVGSFTTIAGQARDMAAFDATTGALEPFDPVITNNVLTVTARSGVVYVGGHFTSAGGEVRNRLAAFDAATAAVLPWDPDVNGVVYDLALGSSTIFAGGSFSEVGGFWHPALVEVDLATGEPLSNIGGSTGILKDVLVHGDNLFVAGDFTDLDSEDRRFLGGFDIATGAVLDTPSPLNVVNAIAASGDILFAGGEFSAVNGVDRNRFAAFKASTLELLPMAPDFQNIVWAIEANEAGDTLYVSGRFVTIDGTARDKVASFDLATGSLTSFDPEVNGDVYAISVTESRLYMGGSFSVVGPQYRNDLASVDRVTGSVSSWAPMTVGIVRAVCAWNDTIFVGGNFSSISGVDRTNVAAIDGTTGDVLDWGSSLSLQASNEVESFFPLDHPDYPNGALFMGGDFLNLGIGYRRGVAALHRNTGNLLYSWDPVLGASYETEVHEFSLVGDNLYMVGDFEGVHSNDCMGAAAVDVVTDEANDWVINAGKQYTIASSDSMIFIGGSSTVVQGYMHSYLVAFRRTDIEVDVPVLGDIPSSLITMYPNHPNPFRPSTTIQYKLQEAGSVQVAVYDVKGRRVVMLQDGMRRAGRHSVAWDGRNDQGMPVSTGVYFARVTAAGTSQTRKMALLR